MAEACGRTVERLTAEPGDVVPLDRIRDALRAGDFDSVTVTYSETALGVLADVEGVARRSEEHTSELQSPCNLVCRLLLEKHNNLEYPAAVVCLIGWGADLRRHRAETKSDRPHNLRPAAVRCEIRGQSIKLLALIIL